MKPVINAKEDIDKLSHPTWVRGLKLEYADAVDYEEWSHPTWVRGLKQSVTESTAQALEVAPYVGAWIETFNQFTIFLSA